MEKYNKWRQINHQTFTQKKSLISATIWVFPKIEGKPPKMDGENNGKPYFLMHGWFGGYHYLWKHPYNIISTTSSNWTWHPPKLPYHLLLRCPKPPPSPKPTILWLSRRPRKITRFLQSWWSTPCWSIFGNLSGLVDADGSRNDPAGFLSFWDMGF